jgi:hypothetical protein
MSVTCPEFTRAEGIKYLTTDPDTGEDTGGLYVPCSRYGRNGADCAPVAWRLAYVLARETGECCVSAEALDHAMSLVVNDHDDVAYIIRAYGGYKYR